MPHLLHYAKSKCRTAAPPHAAHWNLKSVVLGIFLFLSVEFSAVIFWLSRKKALPLYQLKRID